MSDERQSTSGTHGDMTMLLAAVAVCIVLYGLWWLFRSQIVMVSMAVDWVQLRGATLLGFGTDRTQAALIEAVNYMSGVWDRGSASGRVVGEVSSEAGVYGRWVICTIIAGLAAWGIARGQLKDRWMLLYLLS